MSKNVGLKPVQEKFIALFLQGMKIGEAAQQCGVTNATASRWLDNPGIQAEIERRQSAIREAAEQTEQAEIERILTTGYAAIHNRVQALGRMADLIEQSWHEQVEPGQPEKIVWQWVTPDKLREWRGCLDDIAKELGQRVKKSDVTSAGDKLTAPNVIIYLPDVDSEEEENEVGDDLNS